MTDIVPTVLTASHDTLVENIGHVARSVHRIQIDVCDGKFVATRTWPYGAHDHAVFAQYVTGDQGLPHWEDLDFEVDLMVDEPERVLADWVAVGVSSAVIHFRSTHSLEACRAAVGDSVQLGLALRIGDDVESAAAEIAHCDYVQVMGVARPGTQGKEPFDERSIELVRTIRTQYPDLLIQVDGGVNVENAQALLDAGASRLVVGSAIFGSEDPLGALRELQSI